MKLVSPEGDLKVVEVTTADDTSEDVIVVTTADVSELTAGLTEVVTVCVVSGAEVIFTDEVLISEVSVFKSVPVSEVSATGEEFSDSISWLPHPYERRSMAERSTIINIFLFILNQSPVNIIMYTIIITNAGNKFNTNLQKNYDKIRKKYRYFCDIMLKSKKFFLHW